MHSGFVIDFDSSVLITDHHIAFIFVADVLQKSWYAQIRIHVFLLEIVANGVDISKFVWYIKQAFLIGSQALDLFVELNGRKWLEVTVLLDLVEVVGVVEG